MEAPKYQQPPLDPDIVELQRQQQQAGIDARAAARSGEEASLTARYGTLTSGDEANLTAKYGVEGGFDSAQLLARYGARLAFANSAGATKASPLLM